MMEETMPFTKIVLVYFLTTCVFFAIVFIDIAWGMVLSGIVSTSGYFFARWLS